MSISTPGQRDMGLMGGGVLKCGDIVDSLILERRKLYGEKRVAESKLERLLGNTPVDSRREGEDLYDE